MATRGALAGRLAIAPLVLAALGLGVTSQLTNNVKLIGDESTAKIYISLYDIKLAIWPAGASGLTLYANMCGVTFLTDAKALQGTISKTI